MEYMKEILAFYDWAETNEVSPAGILIWHALMHQSNKARWPKRIAVPISVLELRTGLKRSTIYKERNKLRQFGRIEFQARDGNQSAEYEIIPFCVREADTVGDTSNENKSCVHHTDAIVDRMVDTVVDATVDTVVDHIKTNTKTEDEYKDKATKVSKKAGKPAAEKADYQTLIDKFTDNDVLKTAVWDFIQMRIKKKAAPTNRALELVFKNLMSMSTDNDTQIAILNQSTVNNWTNIYPLKDNSKAQGGQNNAANRPNPEQHALTLKSFPM